MYLSKSFVQKSGDSEYSNFVNSKLDHECLLTNFTKF